MISGTLLSRNGPKLVVIAAACLMMAGFVYSNRNRIERVEASTISEETVAFSPDPKKARAAFNEASKVFFSARCSNCHPAGDAPTQSDSMTTHTMDVMRGTDGKGLKELQCATCHQEMNLEGESLPPGAPNWHMPPADQKMAFQGLTAGQLCRQLKDPKMNGGRKTTKEAVEHVKSDPLVLWAWSPGEGRSTPPMSHADFVKKLNEWVDNGAACPE